VSDHCGGALRRAAFFRDHFGATEVGRLTPPGWLIVRLALGAGLIALSPPRAGQALAPAAAGPPGAFSHLALRVQGIDALVSRLRAAGTPITAEPRIVDGTVRVAYAMAPGPIELELLEPLSVPPGT